MFKKLLLALLTCSPVLAHAQLTEFIGKSLTEMSTEASTSSLLESTARSALEAAAAAQMHAPLTLRMPVAPVDVPPAPLHEITPADQLLTYSAIKTVIPANKTSAVTATSQAKGITPAITRAAQTAWSSIKRPWENAKFKKQFKYYMEEFPTTTDAAFQSRMTPEKIEEAKTFYQNFLAMPYNFSQHQNYLISMMMLAYLGKAGDGSGQAIFDFLTSYDLSAEARDTAFLMVKSAIGARQARATLMQNPNSEQIPDELLEEIPQSMDPLDRFSLAADRLSAVTDIVKRNTAIYERLTDLMDRELAADVGFFPYETELTGARCLIMLGEYDLLNLAMERLNQMATITNSRSWMWRKIMPYMQLEFLTNHLQKFLPNQAKEGWPLIFPKWNTERLGIPAIPVIEGNRFIEYFNFTAEICPLGEKIIGNDVGIGGWIRALKAKKFYRPGSAFDDDADYYYPAYFDFDFYEGEYKK